MCIEWAKHGTKISSKEAIVLEKQSDKSWTSRQCMQQQMVYTKFPFNVNPMVLLTEREIIHLINAVEKTTIN